MRRSTEIARIALYENRACARYTLIGLAVACLFFAAQAAGFASVAQRASSLALDASRPDAWMYEPSLSNMVAFFNWGIKEYRPAPGVPFTLPAAWLAQNTIVALLTAVIVHVGGRKSSYQVLIRSIKRQDVWLGRCVVTGGVVIAFFFVEMAFAVGASLVLWGAGSVSLAGLAKSLEILALVVAASLALSACQLALSLLLGPVWSFAMIAAYLIASAFYASPFLLGDYSMVLRSDLTVASGYDFACCVVACAALMLVSVLAGCLIVRRRDDV